MYKVEYGNRLNKLLVKIQNEFIPIGFFSVGSKNYNTERAYRHLNGFQELSINEMISKYS